jgi:isocitrate dehydrogenase kinase/phosphatase
MTARQDDPAQAILATYEGYVAEFRAISARARERFLARDWRGGQEDAMQRLLLYPRTVRQAVVGLEGRIEAGDAGVKERYARLVENRPDAEIAETFFSSVARRVVGTVGVDARTEFTADGVKRALSEEVRAGEPIHRVVSVERCCADAFGELFRSTGFDEAFADLEGDAALCDRSLREQLGDDADAVRAFEHLPFLFYRNKAAYLVARLRTADGRTRPLLVPLLHGADGVRPDAVLTTHDEVSIVFSFARSYFHADTGRPREAIAFLGSLMPAKPLHELYIALGFNKHGKTELFRALTRRLAEPDARFAPVEGVRGMVMTVFTLPCRNVVFKVIKDEFAAPKVATRKDVMARYRMVFLLDRVGRLVDAQEFEHLELPRACFPDEVLDELLRDAGGSVRVDGERVVVRHLYTERRLRPLDVYLREAGEAAAVAAVLDYGKAIKDLACANVFPGDLLLKNFGVSRHGRVIFYDYDEIALLTDVRFRSIPKARHEEDEMSAEAWFSVNEGDVFPEEFVPFLVPPGKLRDAFMEVHGDLFTVRFWRDTQRRHESGEVPDFFPYPQDRRLHRS